MIAKKIGIDLGTTQTRIISPKKGIIVNEPSVVARNVDTGEVLAIGSEALKMIGRTPEAIKAHYPLRNGVIADYGITQTMVKHYINKAMGFIRLSKPEVMVSVPAGATSTERKAVIDVVTGAGAKNTYIIHTTVAAALGAGVPIAEASGNLVVDIGGGISEIAVISLSGVVSQSSVRVGGQKIDSSIADYIRRNYGIIVGNQTAEEIKKLIGSAITAKKNEKMTINGRDVVGGLPKKLEISTNELTPVISEVIDKVVLGIRNVLEQTPPELASDIVEKGMILTGGTSQLKGIDKLLSKSIDIPCIVAKNPALATCNGTGVALENLEDYKRSLVGMQ